MKRAPIIHPYARIDALSEDAMKTIGFRFTSIHLAKTHEGWLRLQVDWNADKEGENHKVKYPERDATGSSSGGGWESEFINLAFPQVPAPYESDGDHGKTHCAGIEIGIGIKTGRRLKPARLRYRYTYHDNTKYGIAMYFSPRDWGSKPDKATLHDWRARKS